MTEQSTIPGLFCFFIAFVSMDARRVELDCAGPPHWRGSPLFGSQCRLRPLHPPGCLCFLFLSLSLFLVSVAFLCLFPCFYSLSLFPVGNKTEFCTAKTF